MTRGVVLTFYSYKGGVGRSLAIANTALLLRERGHRVVVCDLDLEAPGLERYLFSESEVESIERERGFLDLVAAYKRAVGRDGPDADEEMHEFRGVPLPVPRNFVQWTSGRGSQPKLGVLTAGARGDLDGYAEAVRDLDWKDFYKRWGGDAFVDLLREDLSDLADFVLVDARTGVTELGGVATHFISDAVVMMTNATDACVRGTLHMAGSLQKPLLYGYRGEREMHLLPLSSRIEITAENDDLKRFQRAFRRQFRDCVSPLVGDPVGYLEQAEICYVPAYSFGERVVAAQSTRDRHELLYGRYDKFADYVEMFATAFCAERDREAPAETRVFVSYRRGTDREIVQRLQQAIDGTFGPNTAMVDSAPSQDGEWPAELREALDSCAALVVAISPEWLRASDAWGRRLIDRPGDWCRLEVERALETDTPMIPVSFTDMDLVPAEALPESMRPLASCLALRVEDWSKATGMLRAALRQPLGRSPVGGEPPRVARSAKGGVLGAYRDHLRTTHDRLVSFFPKAREHTLEQIYVDLDVQVADRLGEPGGQEHGESGQPSSLRELLARPVGEDSNRAWGVLGEPGAGKSTLARHLTFVLADEASLEVPVLVPVAALVGTDARTPFELAEDALRRSHGDDLAAGLAKALEQIARGFSPGEVWLLLDGLDEIEPQLFEEVRGKLGELVRDFEFLRIAVFSRASGYRDLGEPFRIARLRPLDRAARRELLANWLGEERASQLDAWLSRHPGLATLSSNPLLLTLIARLAIEEFALPAGRVELYARSTDLLLRTPYDRRAGRIRAPQEVLHLLGYLSLELQRDSSTAWPLERLDAALEDASREVPRVGQAVQALWDGDRTAFFQDVARKTGLLAPDHFTGTTWSFLHRQFREYFAAHALSEADDWRVAVGDLGDETIARWSETLGIFCALTDRPMTVLEDLREASPAATVKALTDVDGVSATDLAEFLWSTPSDIDGWAWSPEQLSPYYWDGDDLCRAVLTWVRDARWSEREAVKWLLDRVYPAHTTDRLAWLHFTLSALGWRDDEEFFARCGRPNESNRGPKLVPIPEGEFLMGSPDSELERFDREGPQRRVTVRGFELGETTVTHEQFAGFDQGHRYEDREAKHPVVNVSWWSAYLYCAWIGCRLPTEVEWEYACRAGTTTPFSFGDNVAPDLVNYHGKLPYAGGEAGKFRGKTVRACSLPANEWGLHQMHGNVWEWCEDRWHDNYEGAPEDGIAWLDGGRVTRVLRGGSWGDPGRHCRSAYRGALAPGHWRVSVGFRPARSSPAIHFSRLRPKR